MHEAPDYTDLMGSNNDLPPVWLHGRLLWGRFRDFQPL